MSELEANQVESVRMGYADNLGAHLTRALWDRGRCYQWRTGDFQQNLRRWPKGAMNRHQGSTCRDIQSRGELDELFAGMIAAADEYWYGKRQAHPFTAFHSWPTQIQSEPPEMIAKISNVRISWAKLPKLCRCHPMVWK